MKEKFKVEGMSCASCQAHVQKTVSNLEGVSSCNVSLIEKNMVVEFDETKLNEDKIIKAVNNSGYHASIYQQEPYKLMMAKQKQELKVKKIKIIITLIFLVLEMVIAMGYMLAMENHFVFISNNPLVIIPLGIVCLIPILGLNFHYFTNGFKALFTLKPNMDSLIAIGSTSAIIYGLYIFINIIILSINSPSDPIIHELSNKLYIESAGTIVGLVSLGKYFESLSLNSTMASIYKLMELAPEECLVVKDDKEILTKVKDVKVNDLIAIKPGMKIPFDGKIISGYGNLDESSLTGEALPIYKKENDEVISGTLNKQGSFIFRCEKIGEDTTLNKIISLVQQASNSKAKISQLVDKIAYYFVPIVILIAIVTFISWIFISKYNFDTAFNYAISVLVISCPCALGLATPVAIMVGTGKGAQNGILIKSAQGFENLSSITSVVLDKTGTITKGQMSLIDIKVNKDELSNIYSLESQSDHPLSIAIKNYGETNNLTKKEVKNYKYLPGLGLEGEIDNFKYVIGNFELTQKYLSKETISNFENYSKQGKTVLFIIKDQKYIGLLTLSDTLKDSSKQAIEDFYRLGKKVILLTGDNKNAATYIANKVGIKQVISEIKPDGKLDVIKNLQKEGEKVLMVGDGINDSPALIQADVGMAIGAGSDIAIDSADIILIRSDLLDVISAFLLSKKVVKTIKMNLFWAFFYNTITIPLAAGILSSFNIILNPMIASACMALSSITVVLNALRINFFKREKYNVNK